MRASCGGEWQAGGQAGRWERQLGRRADIASGQRPIPAHDDTTRNTKKAPAALHLRKVVHRLAVEARDWAVLDSLQAGKE